MVDRGRLDSDTFSLGLRPRKKESIMRLCRVVLQKYVDKSAINIQGGHEWVVKFGLQRVSFYPEKSKHLNNNA